VFGKSLSSYKYAYAIKRTQKRFLNSSKSRWTHLEYACALEVKQVYTSSSGLTTSASSILGTQKIGCISAGEDFTGTTTLLLQKNHH
jgi:hypothetical protein